MIYNYKNSATMKSYDKPNETAVYCEQMGMFDALGIKSNIVDIFTWQAFHNERIIRISGVSSDYHINLSYDSFKELVFAGDIYKISEISKIAEGDSRQEIDMTLRLCLDNLWRNYLVKGLFDPGNSDRFIVGLAYDMQASQEQIDRLNYLETHDDLTGLANFRAFDAHFKQISRFGMYPLSLVVAKIDNLNDVFCTLGHHAGNTLAKNVADVIKECFFDAEAIGRTDNGEYCMLFSGKSPFDIETSIKEANLALHSMYLNLIKTEVSFGFVTVDREGDFCSLYQQAKNKLQKERNIRIQTTHPSVIDSINDIISKKTGWGRRYIRIQSLSTQVGAVLGCNEDVMNEIKLLSRIADIGLIGLNDILLLHRANLSDEEKQEYLEHIEIGRTIIAGINTLSDMESLYLDIFKDYNEWKDAIAVPSRIVSATVGFDDLMLINNMMGYREIKKRMYEGNGRAFCPEVVEALLSITKKSCNS